MLEAVSKVLRVGVEARVDKEDVAQLVDGCLFWKVSKKNWYPRRFWLDLDCLCVRYEPSKKPFWTSSTMQGSLDIFTSLTSPNEVCHFVYHTK